MTKVVPQMQVSPVNVRTRLYFRKELLSELLNLGAGNHFDGRYAHPMNQFLKRIFWSLCFCLLLGSACAETIVGKIVGVADGDTVTALDAFKVQHKIRLSGIDASEKAQPFGQRSKKISRNLFLAKM
jgi:hypothetical protein